MSCEIKQTFQKMGEEEKFEYNNDTCIILWSSDTSN